jgi:hypothetical protein
VRWSLETLGSRIVLRARRAIFDSAVRHCVSMLFVLIQFGTCSSEELERDSAKVEVARSNRARSTSRKAEVRG